MGGEGLLLRREAAELQQIWPQIVPNANRQDGQPLPVRRVPAVGPVSFGECRKTQVNELTI